MSDPLVQRFVDFQIAVLCGRASRVETSPFGRAVFMDDFPRFYYGNMLILEQFPEGAGLDDLIAELDRLQDGFEHRLVWTPHPEFGASLTETFAAKGFTPDPGEQFVKLREPERLAGPTIEVLELDPREIDPLRARTLRDEGVDESTVEVLVGRHHAGNSAVSIRSFAARASDGTIASVCDLYSDGATAQLEDVETIAAYRRQGLSRAACQRAMEVAQAEEHDMIVIGADANSMPGAFYRTLGFDDLTKDYAYLRVPSTTGSVGQNTANE